MTKVKIFDKNLEKFITSLEKVSIAKVLRTIELLECFGEKLSMPHSRKLTGELFELRIRGQQEVRILYIFHKKEVILLSGFIKKTGKTPKSEIQKALDKAKRLR